MCLKKHCHSCYAYKRKECGPSQAYSKWKDPVNVIMGCFILVGIISLITIFYFL